MWELWRIEDGEEEMIATGTRRRMESLKVEEIDEAEALVENGEYTGVPEYEVRAA